MAEPLFDIVFRGDIVAGHNIQDVKAGLSQLFKADESKIEALFTGGVVSLKRNVDRPTAEKYKAVLTKAGAQVEVRPAAGTSKPKPVRPAGQKQSPAASAGAAGDQAPAQTASRRFTLAPLGSNLLSLSETRQAPTLSLDLRGITLKPMEGDLLEESEKTRPVTADIEVSDFQLAAAGSHLLEGFEPEELPLPEIDPDFDIAEVGADLLDPTDRTRPAAPEVDTSHLDLLPLKE